MKKCNKCKNNKSRKEYFKDSRSKDGLYSSCKDCHNEVAKTWKKVNSKQKRNYDLQYRYGIDSKQFLALLVAQNYKCANEGCGKELSEGGRGTVVDHDHKIEIETGQIVVRGLLCKQCNTLLGMAFDNPKILQGAKEYLEKWNY